MIMVEGLEFRVKGLGSRVNLILASIQAPISNGENDCRKAPCM